MNFRLARMEDLPLIKAVYETVIVRMNENNIRIWDEIYPCEFFSDDIKNHRLYVLVEQDEIVSALAREHGGKYLRLFVVDINKPAINLYVKNGFQQVDGIYEERIDDETVLYEYGFELAL